jgi:hypothetical protein
VTVSEPPSNSALQPMPTRAFMHSGCYDLACGSARLSAEPLDGGMTRYLLLTLAVSLLGSTPVAAGDSRLDLFVGGGVAFTGPNFYVTLQRDGGLTVKRTGMPIVPPGKLTETTRSFRISRVEAETLLKLAREADDFTDGCNKVADGTSATLTLIQGKKKSMRKCSHAAEWPIGKKSRRFIDRLNKNLPESWQVR